MGQEELEERVWERRVEETLKIRPGRWQVAEDWCAAAAAGDHREPGGCGSWGV